jgi:hypothetical protein
MVDFAILAGKIGVVLVAYGALVLGVGSYLAHRRSSKTLPHNWHPLTEGQVKELVDRVWAARDNGA